MGREKLGISELILSDFTFTYDITVHLCIVLTFQWQNWASNKKPDSMNRALTLLAMREKGSHSGCNLTSQLFLPEIDSEIALKKLVSSWNFIS